LLSSCFSLFFLSIYLSFFVPQITLPSFTLKFPSFKLARPWLVTLYSEGTSPLSPQAPNQTIQHTHAHLPNVTLSLSPDGALSYDGPDFSVGFSPIGIAFANAQLLRSDGVAVLRGDDGEQGVSFDKSGASRHFFFLGKALPSPKFSLKLKVCWQS